LVAAVFIVRGVGNVVEVDEKETKVLEAGTEVLETKLEDRDGLELVEEEMKAGDTVVEVLEEEEEEEKENTDAVELVEEERKVVETSREVLEVE
jgi:hypothetical protein